MTYICPECNQEYDQYRQWCKPCNSTRFKNNFDKWTSGNSAIDKFIQEAQLSANIWKVIEWIPYDKFREVKQIAKGGYGTIYYAKWDDGYIDSWDIKNQRWKRFGRYQVALKKFDSVVDINEDFLHEMGIHLKANRIASTTLFGITQNPETQDYMMVLQYFKGGNLREYLNNNFNDIDWDFKLSYLSKLAEELSEIHKLNIVHRDFHPGNILKYSLQPNSNSICISDFGLSKLISENKKNPNSQNNIVTGVLPYIAPEVLIGREYTKAADVYSFAFIAYEIVTLLPPYHDVSHDKDLAFKICNGLRPKIPFHIPKLITRIIMRCWDARMSHRPTFDELDKELDNYLGDYYEKNYKNSNEITIQIKEAEKFSNNKTATTPAANYKTHPQAIYSSRLLNFSNLPGPKNEVNFEKELEELSESFYQINTGGDDDDLDISNL
ncbi:hypothetical protein Glove_97g114 [Diversispora epigaea]|uniref:Protein kinase domain-containing protein n=1 Tax=Diversispora epigaea TaxID=1348612 RepID=A0A397J738_9GLOM|nr:hypothetical protein Glove_97g114 [Diversispora epigaea]